MLNPRSRPYSLETPNACANLMIARRCCVVQRVGGSGAAVISIFDRFQVFSRLGRHFRDDVEACDLALRIAGDL